MCPTGFQLLPLCVTSFLAYSRDPCEVDGEAMNSIDSIATIGGLREDT